MSLRNRGYYLSFGQVSDVDPSKLSLEELRASFRSHESELCELRKHNRALSDTLWHVSRHPGDKEYIELRLTQQAVEIDTLQNSNRKLTEANAALKTKLRTAQFQQRVPREPVHVKPPVTRTNLAEITQAVAAAKAEVDAQLKRLENPKIEVLKKQLATADRLLAEREEALALLRASPAADPGEVERLRAAVEGYFFQFSGSRGNGGHELEWLTERAQNTI